MENGGTFNNNEKVDTYMEQWSEIRRRVLVEGVSRRQIIRETGMHWDTLQKILAHSEPPGYRQQHPRARKKLGSFLPKSELILQADKALPRKQRHTAKRIFERLQAEGFTGGYTIVKEVVRELTQRRQEVYVPLIHRLGEAQVDFGEALVNLNGRLRKVAFMVLALLTLCWPLSGNARRRSGKARCRGLSFSKACHGGSLTTTRRSRWPRFWAAARNAD